MKTAQLTCRMLGVMVVGIMLVLVAGCGDDGGSPAITITVALTVSPSAGTVITDFEFDGSGSSASRGALAYRWDWESDGTWDTDWSAEPTAVHRYGSAEGGRIDTIYACLQARSGTTSDSTTAQVIVDARHGEIILILNPTIPSGGSLGSDSTYLWMGDWYDSDRDSTQIYKIDPATGAAVDSFKAPDRWPCGIAWDGVNLCVAGSAFYKLDPSTGAVRSQFSIVYSAQGSGLTWDGEAFYFGSLKTESGGDGQIHKYVPDGTELGAFGSPHGSEAPTGLAFDGVNLWASVQDADSIYCLGAETGTVLRSLYINHLGSGLAVLDDYLWAIYSAGGRRLGQIVP
jgi:hypothetical protein